MIKAIIFDFDGVICESVEVKIDAFRRIFAKHPKYLNEILAYHKTNGGLSRYKKFKYIFRNILKEKLTTAHSQMLGRKFSHYTLQGVIESKFVPGAEEFLKKNYQRYQIFIVSGTPQAEMRLIIRKRNLGKYFQGVYGSPRSKAQLIQLILKRGKLKRREVVFVGDSINDLTGAQKSRISFIGRIPSKEKNPFPQSSQIIGFLPDLRRLSAVLK